MVPPVGGDFHLRRAQNLAVDDGWLGTDSLQFPIMPPGGAKFTSAILTVGNKAGDERR